MKVKMIDKMIIKEFTIPHKFTSQLREIDLLILKYNGRKQKKNLESGFRYTVSFNSHGFNDEFNKKLNNIIPNLYKY